MKLIEFEKVISLWDKYHYSIATHAIEFDEELRKLPTVDAVPVEWIEIDIEASAFSGYDMHSYEVATMLEEWKEKERKDDEQTAD